jgi:hypothetical protein
MNTRINKNSEVITNDFDNVNVSNLNFTVVKTVKAKKSTEQKSAIAEKLDAINSEKSNKIAKSIKSIDFLFSSIRSIILSLIANNQSLNVYDSDEIVKTLRRSKKDTELYSVLRTIAQFSYKTVKTKVNEVTTINIVKAFTVTSILRACEVYNSFNSVELTANLLSAILHENELNAVKKIEKNIETLQTEANRLQNIIEKLQDNAKTEKIDLTEKLNQIENQLTEKTKIFEYVKFQTNRQLIK